MSFDEKNYFGILCKKKSKNIFDVREILLQNYIFLILNYFLYAPVLHNSHLCDKSTNLPIQLKFTYNKKQVMHDRPNVLASLNFHFIKYMYEHTT